MTPSLAHFHFDPLYDASGVPSLDELVNWAMARTESAESPLHASLISVYRSRVNRLGSMARLLEFVPPMSRRRKARLDGIIVDSMRRELRRARDLMLEFGIDLRTHRFLGLTLETLASYAMMAPIELEQRQFLADRPDFPAEDAGRILEILDQIDTEQRSAACHASIRVGLENDALISIMISKELAKDRERHIAAMKAAIDEVHQVEMRERLVDMIAKVEAARP